MTPDRGTLRVGTCAGTKTSRLNSVTAHIDSRAPDVDDLVREVDVRPALAGDLSASHACQGHFMTMRARLVAPVQEINLFLRGWAGYFRYGNSAHTFDTIRRYALMRLALFLG